MGPAGLWGPVHQQTLSCPTCAHGISAHPEQSVPVLLGEVLPDPPIPGREESSSWKTPCPALALSSKDHLKYFPLLSAYGALVIPRGCQELCQG